MIKLLTGVQINNIVYHWLINEMYIICTEKFPSRYSYLRDHKVYEYFEL